VKTEIINKMKNFFFHIVGTIPKSNLKIVERGKIDTSNTHVHDSSLSWLCASTSIKSGGIKLGIPQFIHGF
jgi:hypothetical protein